MSSRIVLSAIAAAALCAGALPAFGQASGLDRNVPEIPGQQARPVDRNSFEGAQGERPPRAGRRDQPRQDPSRPEARRDHDNRQPDRRNWDRRGNDRRDYGYVVPRPNYFYAPPAVYFGAPVYSAPPVYYGAVPQPYYPYAAAPLPFNPGDYLPPEYRAQQFVVQDWQWRGLAAPPYGYHWLLLGPDYYALVADATGQILSLVAAR
jgi:Ni/Co efflux regulator RcnB